MAGSGEALPYLCVVEAELTIHRQDKISSGDTRLGGLAIELNLHHAYAL
jgi:hypothetical protein